MQLLFPGSPDPETYLQREAHRQSAPPPSCPHCKGERTWEALGYYYRGITDRSAAKILVLPIRRFRCRRCGRTVSLLPSFAQPYRLVRNETVERYFCGRHENIDVVRWQYLLKRYWQRFENGLPKLSRIKELVLPSFSPGEASFELWERLLERFGELSSMTLHLVGTFQITLFGSYRCHRPNPP